MSVHPSPLPLNRADEYEEDGSGELVSIRKRQEGWEGSLGEKIELAGFEFFSCDWGGAGGSAFLPKLFYNWFQGQRWGAPDWSMGASDQESKDTSVPREQEPHRVFLMGPLKATGVEWKEHWFHVRGKALELQLCVCRQGAHAL